MQRMRGRTLMVCLMLTLISGCVNDGHGPVVIDAGCDWDRPILLTRHDIEVLDSQTRRDILSHNETWQANCQPGSK